MSYRDFTLMAACRTFGLSLDSRADIHRDTLTIEPSSFLTTLLEENVPLGVAIHTEKARSECIVSPILIEVRRLAGRRISLFSGVDFEVDRDRGLVGVCDFLLTRSPNQLFIEVPAVAIVEAKKDDIKAGLGQCAAEMVAAQMYNEREGQGPSVIHGVVTTGSLWRFLRLEGQSLQIDQSDYAIDVVGKILGALLHCVGEAEPTPVLA